MLLKTIVSAALLLSAATPALAASEPQGMSERVSFADLNLATPAGIATLNGRIDGAVRRICANAHPADISAGMQDRQCRVAAYRSVAARRAAVLAAAASRASGGLGAGGTR